MGRQLIERNGERKRLQNVYAEFREVGAPKKWGIIRPPAKRALVVNISKSGMGMRLTERLKPDTLIDAKLLLPGVKDEVHVKAQVRWLREERKLGTVIYTHIVGAHFTQYSPESWQTILKFLGTNT